MVNLLLKEFGDTPLSLLNRRAIEGYLARRRSEGLARPTRNRYLCVMKVILGKGREWGYLRDNPAADLKQEPEDRKLPRPYRDDELATLLTCLPEEPRRVAEVFLHTGMRRGELVKLLWADVDLGGRTLIVKSPKNRRDRTVPLSGRVTEILSERRRQWESECRRGIADPRVYGGRANIRKAVRRAWIQIPAERRAILRPVHSLRDTAITRFVNEGVPLAVVQEFAGHATVEMTRRYAEVSPEAVRQAVERVYG
jgi:integrase